MKSVVYAVFLLLVPTACGSSDDASKGSRSNDGSVGNGGGGRGGAGNSAGRDASGGGGAGGGAAGGGAAGSGAAGGAGGAAGGTSGSGGVDGGIPDAGIPDAPDLGPLPSWRQGVAKWQWVEIAGTSMTTVQVPDPFSGAMVAPTQRINAWNGLAANRDTDRVYLADAGGHADWAGNEAYEIALHVDRPVWRLLRGPTMSPEASDGTRGIFHHYYADGRPSSTHLYFALQFVRRYSRVFKMSSGSIWGTGNEANNKVDGFDLAKNDWDPAGTWAETPGGSPPSATADSPIIARPYAQHPDTEDIYTFFSGAFRKWTAASATWSRLADRPSYANNDIVSESPAAVDPVRNRVLFSMNQYRVSQRQGISYDIALNTIADATYTGSSAAQAVGGSRGLVFVATEDVFLMKLPTGRVVLRIAPTNYEVTEQATTGPAPPDAVNGIYTRWLYLPRLKGIAYLPSGSSNMWFLATE